VRLFFQFGVGLLKLLSQLALLGNCSVRIVAAIVLSTMPMLCVS
jgi:hypothetical protein